jgi:hypothetical protein
MSSNKNELIERFYISQERNTYFLLAASASAIGFAITQVKTEPLTLTHIPLGIAIFLWAASFYCGQQFVQWSISAVGKEADYLSKDFFPERPDEIKKTVLHKTINLHASKMNFYGKLQLSCLLLGAVSYITFHVLKMICVSVSV